MTDAQFALSAFRQMVKSDLQGGTASLLSAAYDCTIGLFSKRDMLVDGGVRPMMIGDIQLALADLPDGLALAFGTRVTVVPNTGRARQCTLYTADYSGPLVVLTLHDANEGA